MTTPSVIPVERENLHSASSARTGAHAIPRRARTVSLFHVPRRSVDGSDVLKSEDDSSAEDVSEGSEGKHVCTGEACSAVQLASARMPCFADVRAFRFTWVDGFVFRTCWILGDQSRVSVGESECTLSFHRSRFAVGGRCESETSCHHESSDGRHHDHVLRRSDVSRHGVAANRTRSAWRAPAAGLRKAGHVGTRRQLCDGHGGWKKHGGARGDAQVDEAVVLRQGCRSILPCPSTPTTVHHRRGNLGGFRRVLGGRGAEAG